MSPQSYTLLVPNVLSATVDEAEQLYLLADTVPPANQYTFDMQLVDFVNPYGVLVLVTTARRLSSSSHYPVQLENLRAQIHRPIYWSSRQLPDRKQSQQFLKEPSVFFLAGSGLLAWGICSVCSANYAPMSMSIVETHWDAS